MLSILADNLSIELRGIKVGDKTLLRRLPYLLQDHASAHRRKCNSLDTSKRIRRIQAFSFFYPAHGAKKGRQGLRWTEISYGNFEETDNIIFEHTTSVGTGTTDFLSIIERKVKLTSSSRRRPDRTGHRQKHIPYSLFAHLHERYSWGTLEYAWGAALEWTWYNGKRFEKFGDVAYVLHSPVGISARTWVQSCIYSPLLILYYQYHDDDLIIIAIEVRSLHERKHRKNTLELKAEKCSLPGLSYTSPLGSAESSWSP